MYVSKGRVKVCLHELTQLYRTAKFEAVLMDQIYGSTTEKSFFCV
jgi:hypothetical protein